MVDEGTQPRISHPPAQPEFDPSKSELESTLKAIPDLMFELDSRGCHVYSRALHPELLVAPPEELLGHTVAEVMPPEAAQTVMAALDEALKTGYSHGAQINLTTARGPRWFEISMARKGDAPVDDPRVVVLSRDITERRQQFEQTEHMAYFDCLTELPNRQLLLDRLKLALNTSKETGHYGAVLFLDLDNFKAVNDTNGHHLGDELLKRIGGRLQHAVRAGDLVARWGGDEFVILIQGLDKDPERASEEAESICDQVASRLEDSFKFEGVDYLCHVSIGVCLFNSDQQSPDSIIDSADRDMYRAKQQRSRNRHPLSA